MTYYCVAPHLLQTLEDAFNIRDRELNTSLDVRHGLQQKMNLCCIRTLETHLRPREKFSAFLF